MKSDEIFSLGQKLWKDSCSLWGIKGFEYVYDVLYNFYGSTTDESVENYRFYHSMEHIISLLNNFHLLKDNFNIVCPEEIELAIWFHDLIQDRASKTNEQRSAQIAHVICVALGLNTNQINRITDMILATDHATEPKTEDCGVMLDLDLSILSEDWDAFYSVYMTNIKNEYVHMFAEKDFLNGRLSFLKRLNNKEWIYNSKWFRKEREHIARSNVQREISIIKTKLEEIEKINDQE